MDCRGQRRSRRREESLTPFVAWYRNPSRAAPSALRIAYEDDANRWGSLQVDFIIISRRDDGIVAASIVVDPHGDHLADAKVKLRGLADYAEKFRDRYRSDAVAATPAQRRATPRSPIGCRQFFGPSIP
jgi:type III restriction enzyme